MTRPSHHLEDFSAILSDCHTPEALAGFVAARTPAVPFTAEEHAVVLRRERELMRREGR